jgi:hypothetical protein
LSRSRHGSPPPPEIACAPRSAIDCSAIASFPTDFRRAVLRIPKSGSFPFSRLAPAANSTSAKPAVQTVSSVKTWDHPLGEKAARTGQRPKRSNRLLVFGTPQNAPWGPIGPRHRAVDRNTSQESADSTWRERPSPPLDGLRRLPRKM